MGALASRSILVLSVLTTQIEAFLKMLNEESQKKIFPPYLEILNQVRLEFSNEEHSSLIVVINVTPNGLGY